MYQMVCDAVAVPGKALGTAIFLAESDSTWLRRAAGSGKHTINMKVSSDPDIPEGQGLAGRAFRTGEVCVCHDYLSDANPALAIAGARQRCNQRRRRSPRC